jgi:hypothetical protein
MTSGGFNGNEKVRNRSPTMFSYEIKSGKTEKTP